MTKLIILVLLILFVAYRCTRNFNFNVVEIASWKHSTKYDCYLVEFRWNDCQETLSGFYIADEPPSLNVEDFKIEGYDFSKGLWLVKKTKK